MLTALRRRTFPFPLVAISALALALLGARVLYGDTPEFLFLAFNLFLAWIPTALSALRWRGPVGVMWMLVWLLFFPNAPYLVTDLMHLRPRYGIPFWYDVGMLSTFAFAGVFLAGHSLSHAHAQVRARFGGVIGWGFVIATSALSGLGIYIGRFLRWNSWSVFTAPRGLVRDAIHHVFLSPAELTRALGVSAVFGALMLSAYLSIGSARPSITDSIAGAEPPA